MEGGVNRRKRQYLPSQVHPNAKNVELVDNDNEIMKNYYDYDDKKDDDEEDDGDDDDQRNFTFKK